MTHYICPRIQITQTKTDTKKAVRERSSPIFTHLSIRKYSQPFSFIQQFISDFISDESNWEPDLLADKNGKRSETHSKRITKGEKKDKYLPRCI